MPKLLPQIVCVDKTLQRATRGRVTVLDIAGLPNLALTVPGRKSGIPRTTPLLCVPHEGGWLIAGLVLRRAERAAVGRATCVPPTPSTSASTRSASTPAPAREIEGEERARMWQVDARDLAQLRQVRGAHRPARSRSSTSSRREHAASSWASTRHPTTSIAHLSDPHLLADEAERQYGAVDPEAGLRLALEPARRASTGHRRPWCSPATWPTGPSPAAYARLRALVEPAAADARRPGRVVMGNHDERCRLPRGLFGVDSPRPGPGRPGRRAACGDGWTGACPATTTASSTTTQLELARRRLATPAAPARSWRCTTRRSRCRCSAAAELVELATSSGSPGCSRHRRPGDHRRALPLHLLVHLRRRPCRSPPPAATPPTRPRPTGSSPASTGTSVARCCTSTTTRSCTPWCRSRPLRR